MGGVGVYEFIEYPDRAGLVAAVVRFRGMGVRVDVVGNGLTLRLPTGVLAPVEVAPVEAAPVEPEPLEVAPEPEPSEDDPIEVEPVTEPVADAPYTTTDDADLAAFIANANRDELRDLATRHNLDVTIGDRGPLGTIRDRIHAALQGDSQ